MEDPERMNAIEAWLAQRDPRLKPWYGLIACIAWLALMAIVVQLITGMMAVWPTWQTAYQSWQTAYQSWQTAYQHAGGWSLMITPTVGPPVPVDTYLSQESCETIRALDLQEAYHSNRPIPPLICVPKYHGWQRLLYATRTPTPAASGR